MASQLSNNSLGYVNGKCCIVVKHSLEQTFSLIRFIRETLASDIIQLTNS